MKHAADNCVLYLPGGDAEMNFVHDKIIPASLRSLRKQSSRTHFPRLTKADEKSVFFGCGQYLMYGKSEKALNSNKYNFNNLEIESLNETEFVFVVAVFFTVCVSLPLGSLLKTSIRL